jgi:PAS domain S-box-containing protein
MQDSFKNRMAGFWIVAVYALFGSLWVLYSDAIPGLITSDPELLQNLLRFKGIAFILVTTLLLYHLIRLHVERASAANSRLAVNMKDLEAAHERLELADFSIRAISDAVYWCNLDGGFIDCNEAAHTMLGYSRDEFLGMSVLDIDPDYASHDIAADLDRLKRTGSNRLIRHHRTRDGRCIPVEINSNYLACHGKEYVCSIARDITARVSAEKETTFFRSLIEYTRDPFYVLSPDEGFRMVYANQAACEHFGKDLGQLQRMRIPDWDPEFDMQQIGALNERMKKGESVRFETVHKVSPDKLVPVELTSSYLVHDGRKYTCGYFYDISERKAMENALKESEAKFRTLSLEFQALLDGIPYGLTLLSPDLTILWANPAAAHATSRQATEIIGRHCFELWQERCAPCDDCIVRETFATGRECKTVTETRPMNRSIELRSVPVRDEAGKVVKVIEIGRDITKQIAAQAERIELERKLLHSQKLESLGILAGGIAHDFNNILTGILGNLSILRILVPNSDKALERLERCEKAVSQATSLTCQLLTFAKGGDPVKKPLNLGHVIENAVSLALTGSNVTGETNIAKDLWTVAADEGQIGQVLNNLLINAAQAMPRGGAIQVQAANRLLDPDHQQSTSLKSGRYVEINVSDHGQGIPSEHLAKIFDPYFTTKETGTGLGLTSAYSIVNKHGGDIRVSSQVREGTRFEVYLPATVESTDCEESSVSQAIAYGNGSVLVMDDEAYIRDMVSEMLSHLGYDFQGCCCGEELIRIYREKIDQGQVPDAVIIDLTIRGGMGGLDAATAILEMDPAARLIVASGYSTDPVMANHREYGFSAALAKPYRLEDLGTTLAQVLTH